MNTFEKFKSIEELSRYFGEEDMLTERKALLTLICTVIPEYDSAMRTRVFNGLWRNLVLSIRTLHETSIDEISNFRTIGVKALTYITMIKSVINNMLEES